MKYKAGMIASIIIAFIPVIMWASTGRHFATRYNCKTAVCQTEADCSCTEANGCLDKEKETITRACKSRKICYSNQDRRFKLTACNTANDCVDEEYQAEADWSCQEAKQCFDNDFAEYIEDAEAPTLPCFQFGLTPSGLFDGVLPISGFFMGLAALLFVIRWRQNRA